MTFDHHFVSFLIRWVHVVSMGFLLGGAFLLWGLTVKPIAVQEQRERLLLLIAERYEWLFWGAVGLLVATGIGNLGAFGNTLPDRLTPWGGKMMIKLFTVLFFLLLSMLRTLLIIRFSFAESGVVSAPQSKTFQFLYAGTALYLAAVLLAAVALAHF
jgi:uncharacterized membrane protein